MRKTPRRIENEKEAKGKSDKIIDLMTVISLQKKKKKERNRDRTCTSASVAAVVIQGHLGLTVGTDAGVKLMTVDTVAARCTSVSVCCTHPPLSLSVSVRLGLSVSVQVSL